MKPINRILWISLIFLTSLSAEEEKNIPWVPGDIPLAKFAENHQGKDILVFYTAEWCLVSQLMKNYLKSDEFTQLLSRRNLVVVNFDCSDGNSIGSNELKRGGEYTKTLPVISILHHDGMVTYANLEMKSKEILMKTITSILKKAEQVGAPSPLPAE